MALYLILFAPNKNLESNPLSLQPFGENHAHVISAAQATATSIPTRPGPLRPPPSPPPGRLAIAVMPNGEFPSPAFILAAPVPP